MSADPDAKLVCWRCGTPLEPFEPPLPRAETCRACNADLHVCRMCRLFDPRVAKQCREPVAEEVKEKERANFCGYFEIRPGAYTPRDAEAAARARAELETLFGAPASGTATARDARQEADEARRRLDELFGGGDG